MTNTTAQLEEQRQLLLKSIKSDDGRKELKFYSKTNLDGVFTITDYEKQKTVNGEYNLTERNQKADKTLFIVKILL